MRNPILLYSKYSQACRKLFELVQESGVNLADEIDLLCIDNKDVRARVLQDDRYKISVVPCVLIAYPDGGVAQFDGEHGFNWVETMLEQKKPVSPPTPPPPPPPPQQPQPPTQPLQPQPQEPFSPLVSTALSSPHDSYRQEPAESEETNSAGSKAARIKSQSIHDRKEQMMAEREAVDKTNFNQQNIPLSNRSGSGGGATAIPTRPEYHIPPSKRTELDDRLMRQGATNPETEDRYRNVEQPKRVRQNALAGEAVEDPNFFSGEVLENRLASTATASNVGKDTKARADEMARAREIDMKASSFS